MAIPALTITQLSDESGLKPVFGVYCNPKLNDTFQWEWAGNNFTGAYNFKAAQLKRLDRIKTSLFFDTGALTPGTYYFRLRQSRTGETDVLSNVIGPVTLYQYKAATITYRDKQTSPSNSSGGALTLSGLAFAAGKRHLICVSAAGSNTWADSMTCTVNDGGVRTTTKLASHGGLGANGAAAANSANNQGNCAIFLTDTTIAGTASVTVNYAPGFGRLGVAILSIEDFNPVPTITRYVGGGGSVTYDIHEYQAAVLLVSAQNSGAPALAVTWTGATIVMDETIENLSEQLVAVNTTRGKGLVGVGGLGGGARGVICCVFKGVPA